MLLMCGCGRTDLLCGSAVKEATPCKARVSVVPEARMYAKNEAGDGRKTRDNLLVHGWGLL